MRAWDDPDFRTSYAIVGTQKGGTTALNSYLLDHPQVCGARFVGDSNPRGLPRETHFFDDDRFFPEGRPAIYSYYHLFFHHYKGQAAIGETTPSYMYLPRVAQRLRQYNPDLKLICVLRDPAARAYSHYQMVRGVIGQETLPFSLAIRLEPLRLWWRGDLRNQGSSPRGARRLLWCLRHAYVARGFYMRQIRHLLSCFPREQMLFVRSEDLLDRHAETLARVFGFLGLEPLRSPEPRRVFAGSYRPLPRRDRAFLVRRYARELAELEQFLDWDLSAWRAPHAAGE